jgi:hypothetical protein
MSTTDALVWPILLLVRQSSGPGVQVRHPLSRVMTPHLCSRLCHALALGSGKSLNFAVAQFCVTKIRMTFQVE